MNLYRLFRFLGNGPIASLLKRRAFLRGKEVAPAPSWHEKTWWELLVLTYPTAALIGWLLP